MFFNFRRRFSRSSPVDAAEAKIAFVTCITGRYEKTAKRHTRQTVPTDFVIYADHPPRKAETLYRVCDVNGYALGLSEQDVDPKYINNLKSNTHSFNRAKFIKCNLHRLPELRQYDYLVWLDGTIKIVNEQFSAQAMTWVRESPICVWQHHANRGHGQLLEEVRDSHFERYTSTFWNGQPQPYQDVDKQYDAYVQAGYRDKWFGGHAEDNLGVWLTGIMVLNMKDPRIPTFFGLWWEQVLTYTTQDQISFPYVCWKQQLVPATLPFCAPQDDVGTDLFHCKYQRYYRHGR